jgi:predicted nucleotidyltransferase
VRKIELNIFNDDFREFIQALGSYNVDYLLIGGYSVILYGYHRTTGDMDIWVRKTALNYDKLTQAMNSFGLPASMIGSQRFLNAAEYDVFTFGRPPVAIDIVTEINGVDFEVAFNNKEIVEVDGLQVNLISKTDLIITKTAVGRYKDLDDLENLSID